MARKFFKQKVHKVPGPGKELNFLSDENEITEEEAKEVLANFFECEADNAEEMREKAWQHILNGTSVTIEDTCLTSKV